MPDIVVDENVSMQQLSTASNYRFSAVGLDSLSGASEYTLATVVVDVSGSVSSYRKQLEDCLKTILKSCQSSPRKHNLLFRLVMFSDTVVEVHGFRLLTDIKEKEYTDAVQIGGCTSLFDAVQSCVEATADYGKLLVDQDYSANGVIYVLTDGANNMGKATAKTCKKAIDKAKKEEKLESIAVILVGVGYSDNSTVVYLDDFRKDADITQFVDLTDLFQKTSPEKTLAKLAGYISRSISSTSQALASGTSTVASSKLTF